MKTGRTAVSSKNSGVSDPDAGRLNLPESHRLPSTGPRTKSGKERASHNAIKHGIFSKVLVLECESQIEFTSLLQGIRTDIQPAGTLENALVEKLAASFWRYRRFIQAETGEIRKNMELHEWNLESDESENANAVLESNGDGTSFSDRGGLIVHAANPKILNWCIELLTGLYRDIDRLGFNEEHDTEILGKIYGADEHPWHTVKDEYGDWLCTSCVSEEERQQNDYPSPQKCVSNVLVAIKTDMARLVTNSQIQKKMQGVRIRLDKLRGSIPGSPAAECLLRYEAALERSIDRTLTQIERLQRMRLGQPVVPPIKVDVSG